MEAVYKYNPQDYEDLLRDYMEEFYRAYEEKNHLQMVLAMQRLHSETQYAMKEGDISPDIREEMLTYFGGLIDG